MRDILFRGKRIDNGEWVEGQTIVVIHQDDNDLIFMPQHGEDVKADPMEGNDRALTSIYGNYYQILPQTVGQYTGLSDKNGKKIFEGDIIQCFWYVTGEKIIGSVEFYEHTAKYCVRGSNHLVGLYQCRMIENIGNIHDNSELLEV